VVIIKSIVKYLLLIFMICVVWIGYVRVNTDFLLTSPIPVQTFVFGSLNGGRIEEINDCIILTNRTADGEIVMSSTPIWPFGFRYDSKRKSIVNLFGMTKAQVGDYIDYQLGAYRIEEDAKTVSLLQALGCVDKYDTIVGFDVVMLD